MFLFQGENVVKRMPIFSRNRKRSTIVLLLGGALVTFVMVMVASTLPLIGAEFKVNNSELGLVLAVFVAGFGLFQIPAGLGALKVGTRQIYLIGLR